MGVDNTYCIVFVLGLVLFLGSMEQASAIFDIPTEITQEELTESYFQKVIEYVYKIKQINSATQKLDEILGGKSTANSDFYKTKFITSSTSKFLVDNQTPSMKRTDESFQNYKDEQIVALEKIKDELMEQNRFMLNQKNYETRKSNS